LTAFNHPGILLGVRSLDIWESSAVKILVIDVGGTNIKLLASGETTPRRFASGKSLTPEAMVGGVQEHAADWQYEVISMGYPGPVRRGKPRNDPWNLAPGWINFDFESAFNRPVRMVNDAAMQALGSYEGGKMLFLGLGTGLGSALIYDGVLEPLELAHLPYKKNRTFEDYLGVQGLERRGAKKWRKSVADIVERLLDAFEVDYIVLGGGNAKKLTDLPKGARLGANTNAFVGGFRLWENENAPPAPATAANAPLATQSG
jgi:polyphosphate glucokinase